MRTGRRAGKVTIMFPYLESLLSFLELNPEDWEPLIQQAASDLEQFFTTGDAAHTDRTMQTLGELGARHIYFQLLYLRHFERRAKKTLESRMAEELRLLPARLKVYQEQAQSFLERILDIDQVGRAVQQNTKLIQVVICKGKSHYVCNQRLERRLGQLDALNEARQRNSPAILAVNKAIAEASDKAIRSVYSRARESWMPPQEPPS